MADLSTQVLAAVPAGTPITSVVVDNSLYTGPLTASGWGAGDAPSSYAAPVTATMVDGARVTPGSDARSGQPGIDAGAARPRGPRVPRSGARVRPQLRPRHRERGRGGAQPVTGPRHRRRRRAH